MDLSRLNPHPLKGNRKDTLAVKVGDPGTYTVKTETKTIEDIRVEPEKVTVLE